MIYRIKYKSNGQTVRTGLMNKTSAEKVLSQLITKHPDAVIYVDELEG